LPQVHCEQLHVLVCQQVLLGGGGGGGGAAQ